MILIGIVHGIYPAFNVGPIQKSGSLTLSPGVGGYYHSSHHHRNHHRHVLYCHRPSHPPSSLPSPVHPRSGSAPPIVHSPRSSPRSTMDYDMPRSSLILHPTTNSMMLSPSSNLRHGRRNEFQRNMDAPIQHSPSMFDYPDRDTDLQRPYSHRPSSHWRSQWLFYIEALCYDPGVYLLSTTPTAAPISYEWFWYWQLRFVS